MGNFVFTPQFDEDIDQSAVSNSGTIGPEPINSTTDELESEVSREELMDKWGKVLEESAPDVAKPLVRGAVGTAKFLTENIGSIYNVSANIVNAAAGEYGDIGESFGNALAKKPTEGLMHMLGYDDFSYDDYVSQESSGQQLADITRTRENYDKYETAYQGIGAVVDIAMGGVGTAKLMSRGSIAYQGLRKLGLSSTALDTIFTSKQVANRGMVKYKNLVKQAAEGKSTTSLGSLTGLKSAKHSAISGSVANAAKSGAYTIAGEWGTALGHDMLDSAEDDPEWTELLWSKDASLTTNLAFNSLPMFGAVFSGLNAVAKANKIAKAGDRYAASLMSDFASAYAVKQGLNPNLANQAGTSLAQYTNTGRLLSKDTDATFKVYQRNIAQAYKISAEEGVGTLASDVVTQATKEASENLLQKRALLAGSIRNMVKADASNPEEIVSIASKVTEEYPNALLNARNISSLPVTTGEVSKGLSQIAKLKAKAKSLAGSAFKENDLAKAQKLNEIAETADSRVYLTTGESTPLANYAPSFQDNLDNIKNIRFVEFNNKITKNKLPSSSIEYSLTKSDGSVELVKPYVDYSGIAYDKSGNLLEVKPENSSMIYALLSNNLKNSSKILKKLEGSKQIINLDINKMPYQQIDYLDSLYNKIGQTRFNELFNIKNVDKVENYLIANGASPNNLSDVFSYTSLAKKRKKIKLDFAEKLANPDGDSYPITSRLSEYYNLTGGTASGDDVLNQLLDSRNSTLEIYKSGRIVEDSRLNYTPKKGIVVNYNSADIATEAEYQNFVLQNMVNAKSKIRSNLIDLDNKSFAADIARLAANHPVINNNWVGNVLKIGEPTEPFGALGRAINTSTFNSLLDQNLRAADSFNTFMKGSTRTLIANKLKPVVLAYDNLRKDRDGLMQFSKFVYQKRSGYKLLNTKAMESVDQYGNTVYSFVLDPDKLAINLNVQKRANWLSQRNLDFAYVGDTAYLADPETGKVLTLNENAYQAVKATVDASDELYESTKALNSSLGLKTVQYDPWHPMARDYSDLEILAVVDTEGRPITFVGGRTPYQVNKLAEKEAKLIGRGTRVADLKTIGLNKESLSGETEIIFQGFGDYTDLARQMNSPANQGLGQGGIRTSMGLTIDVGDEVLNDQLNSLTKNFYRTASRTRRVLLGDQVGQLELMAKTIGSKDPRFRLVADLAAKLTGKPAPKDRYDLFSLADNVLGYASDLKSDIIYKLNAKQREKILNQMADSAMGRKPKPLIESIEDGQLWGLSAKPAEDAFEAAQRLNLLEKRPIKGETMRAINATLTTAMLRVFNPSQAFLNVGGNLAPMPMLIAMTKRLPNETKLEWAARSGAWEIPSLAAEPTPSTYSLIKDAINYMFTPEGKGALAKAREVGAINIPEESLNDLIKAGGLRKFGSLPKTLLKTLTELNDKSETFSMELPYAMGIVLAKKSGLKTQAGIESFARTFTNRANGARFADKGWLFSGSTLGQAMGLYNTYVQNMWEQLFESLSLGGNRQALKSVMGFAATFGVKNNLVTNLIANKIAPEEAGKSIDSWLVNNLGLEPAAADIVTRGPFSVTGLDLGGKGGLGFIKNPFSGTSAFPSVSVTQRTLQGLADTVNSIAETGEVSTNSVIGSLQNYFPVPLVRGMASLFTGYKTNRNNEIVLTNQDVGRALYYASAFAGVPTIEETKRRELTYRQSQLSLSRQNRLAAYRNVAYGYIRAGNWEGVSSLTNKMVEQGLIGAQEVGPVIKTWAQGALMDTMMKSVKKAGAGVKRGDEASANIATDALSSLGLDIGSINELTTLSSSYEELNSPSGITVSKPLRAKLSK